MQWWALALFGLFAFECAHHEAMAASEDHSYILLRAYAILLNVTYLLQLCVVTVPAFVAIIERRKGSISL